MVKKEAILGGIRYVEAFRILAKFYKDSSAIVIKPLIVNSRHNDFSPAFYKSGILSAPIASPDKYEKLSTGIRVHTLIYITRWTLLMFSM
jgi:hypothetical protein